MKIWISTTICTTYAIMHKYHENGHLVEICIVSFKNQIIIIRKTFKNLETHKKTFKPNIIILESLYSEVPSLYSEVPYHVL